MSQRIVFEPEMLFQGKKDAFPRNEHVVIKVISTDLQKAGPDIFYSYDDANTDIKKLVVQSSLK